MRKSRNSLLTELLNLGLACQICGDLFKATADIKVDHDHATDKARGMLCNRCNTGLGMFRDNRTFLMNAIAYLSGDHRTPINTTTDDEPNEATKPADGTTASNEENKLLDAKAVADLLGISLGDVFKLRRLVKFPKHRMMWDEREVLAIRSVHGTTISSLDKEWQAKRESLGQRRS